MAHILIVGKKFSGLVDKISQLGYEYTVLQDAAATKYPEKKIKHRIVADFSSEDAVLRAVDAVHEKAPIDAVISVYENYILMTALIGKHLGIHHLPISAAEACTDKFLMRSLFANAPEKVSPSFAIVNNEDDVRTFADTHSFPLILKPANLAKSLLVTKSNSLNELVANYTHSVELLQSTYKKYAPNRTPKLIIEEFLEGSIHSIDAFVDCDGIPHLLEEIVDYQTGYDIGYDDNFHYSRLLPSALSDNDKQKLRHCAEISVRALGMKSSPAHIEIIMTKDGPRVVEIGARNGGYRERMHRLANGIDIAQAALDLALGKTPVVKALKHDPVAVLELFPRKPGNFIGIHNEESLRQLSSLVYLSVKPQLNEFVGKAGDGYKMCAVVILHNSDREQFKQDLEFINTSVFVETITQD